MLRCLLIGEFTSQWSMHVNGETMTLQVHEMRVNNRQSKDNNYVYNRSWPTESLSFSSVAQLCLTVCKPMNCSTPGFPVQHQLSEFTQTHIHLVGDAIQPSHPLSSPSLPAPNPSQHQSLFQ